VGPHLTQCLLGRGLLPTKWHLDSSSRLATTDMGRKLRGHGCAPLGGGARSPSNTVWPGPRPTCMLSFILIRLTVWPQYTNAIDKQDRQTGQDRQDRQTDNGPIAYRANCFYSAPQCSHCKRCTSYSISVSLSVRLSHAGIVSKRRHLAQCN